jgi:hypothetical protein
MRGELELAAEPNPSRLSTFAAFLSSGLDQLPFKFGKATAKLRTSRLRFESQLLRKTASSDGFEVDCGGRR